MMRDAVPLDSKIKRSFIGSSIAEDTARVHGEAAGSWCTWQLARKQAWLRFCTASSQILIVCIRIFFLQPQRHIMVERAMLNNFKSRDHVKSKHLHSMRPGPRRPHYLYSALFPCHFGQKEDVDWQSRAAGYCQSHGHSSYIVSPLEIWEEVQKYRLYGVGSLL